MFFLKIAPKSAMFAEKDVQKAKPTEACGRRAGKLREYSAKAGYSGVTLEMIAQV